MKIPNQYYKKVKGYAEFLHAYPIRSESKHGSRLEKFMATRRTLAFSHLLLLESKKFLPMLLGEGLAASPGCVRRMLLFFEVDVKQVHVVTLTPHLNPQLGPADLETLFDGLLVLGNLDEALPAVQVLDDSVCVRNRTTFLFLHVSPPKCADSLERHYTRNYRSLIPIISKPSISDNKSQEAASAASWEYLKNFSFLLLTESGISFCPEISSVVPGARVELA